MKVMTPFRTRSLKDTELFRSLESSEVGELEKAARWEKLRRGRVLWLSDHFPASLVLVKRGRMKLSRLSGKGKELVLDILGPEDVFGEVSLVDESPPRALAEALEDSLVAVIPGRVLKQTLEDRPDFFMRLSHLMAARYQRLEDRLLELAFESTTTRLARLLLQLSREHGVQDSRGTFIPIRLSQATLGGLLGVSRESINVNMSRLRERGALTLESRHLIIHQQNLLEELHA
jgi:CRP/FNR family cyclic AMP-dependent transcriptional regulator